jgi:hypothetical protein
MKKIILLLAFMACYAASAQIDSTAIFRNKHEVKFGAVKLLAGGIFEGTYEYIHSPYFTYGASILANFDKGNSYEEDFSFTPFVRFYFTEPKVYGAKGFFVEGFAKYLTGKEYDYVSYNDNGDYVGDWVKNPDSYSTGAVGLSLGWKWINHTGFVFEILAGIGNNFGNAGNIPGASFRGDLNLGYRF